MRLKAVNPILPTDVTCMDLPEIICFIYTILWMRDVATSSKWYRVKKPWKWCWCWKCVITFSCIAAYIYYSNYHLNKHLKKKKEMLRLSFPLAHTTCCWRDWAWVNLPDLSQLPCIVGLGDWECLFWSTLVPDTLSM